MKTFNYTPTNPVMSKLTTIGIALFMIVFPLIAPFGIRIGRMRILGPTAVTVIFVLGGAALLIFTLLEIRKARVLAAQGASITVDGDKVTYPVVKKDRIEQGQFNITDIEWVKYDDEENECKIKTVNDHIILRTDFFENWEAYEAFRALLGK